MIHCYFHLIFSIQLPLMLLISVLCLLVSDFVTFPAFFIKNQFFNWYLHCFLMCFCIILFLLCLYNTILKFSDGAFGSLQLLFLVLQQFVFSLQVVL